MKSVLFTCATLLLLCPAWAQATPKWHAGVYHNIVTGQSTRQDVVAALGEPDSIASDQRSEVLTYKRKGEFDGDVKVRIRKATNRVHSVLVMFAPALPRMVAYRQFGREYQETRYSVLPCSNDTGMPNVYRDRKGNVELIEMPDKGLILWPDQVGYDFAVALFLPEPLPKVKGRCPAKK